MKQDAERRKGIQGTKHRQKNTGRLLGRLSKEENPHQKRTIVSMTKRKDMSASPGLVISDNFSSFHAIPI